MAKRNHWGHALTAIGLVGTLAGCSNSLSRANSASAVRVDPSKVGIAMKAQDALQAGDLATALSLGEAAVEYRPGEASFRALLGNIYLAAGRYGSAETTYRDALKLGAPDPQVVLKYVLVQIAQGKYQEATAMLGEARSLLDPADLGLALALAGRASDAVAVLEPAARLRGADARTRQNLAFAYALGGDWQQARVVAQQDLAADQVDARMAEWLKLAKPGQGNSQVAMFIGIQPAASDPGLPTRLALNAAPGAVQYAEAAAGDAPVAPPATVAAPTVETPLEVAVYEPAVPPSVAPPLPLAGVEPARDVAPAMRPDPVARPVARKFAVRAPLATPAANRLTPSLASLHRTAALRIGNGKSRAVVQLGAYNSRAFIAGAWSRAAHRHAALRDFTPVTARFEGAKGTFYRLSVKGFASDRQAIDLCNSLKRAGAPCFVRAAFNDAPVRLASR